MKKKSEVVMWDHREHISDQELNQALFNMGSKIRVRHVNTHSDMIALVLTEGPVSENEAQQLYDDMEKEISCEATNSTDNQKGSS